MSLPLVLGESTVLQDSVPAAAGAAKPKRLTISMVTSPKQNTLLIFI
jgi:hypothetical protein